MEDSALACHVPAEHEYLVCFAFPLYRHPKADRYRQDSAGDRRGVEPRLQRVDIHAATEENLPHEFVGRDAVKERVVVAPPRTQNKIVAGNAFEDFYELTFVPAAQVDWRVNLPRVIAQRDLLLKSNEIVLSHQRASSITGRQRGFMFEPRATTCSIEKCSRSTGANSLQLLCQIFSP